VISCAWEDERKVGRHPVPRSWLFMRAARNLSRSGDIVRSSFDTAYQLGFDRQAGRRGPPAEERGGGRLLLGIEHLRLLARDTVGEYI